MLRKTKLQLLQELKDHNTEFSAYLQNVGLGLVPLDVELHAQHIDFVKHIEKELINAE